MCIRDRRYDAFTTSDTKSRPICGPWQSLQRGPRGVQPHPRPRQELAASLAPSLSSSAQRTTSSTSPPPPGDMRAISGGSTCRRPGVQRPRLRCRARSARRRWRPVAAPARCGTGAQRPRRRARGGDQARRRRPGAQRPRHRRVARCATWRWQPAAAGCRPPHTRTPGPAHASGRL